MSSSSALFAADLFAGGGGLTVGLKDAEFQVVSAVEIDPHACATYTTNHPEVRAFCQDISTLKGRRIQECSPSGKIDLLAGCPPCQGFTSLTAKKKTEDPRNALIREMARLIKEVKPRAVMMENVPGLSSSSRGRSLFAEFLEQLDDLKYNVNYGVLQVADFGVPQRRRRFVLVAGRGFRIDLPKPTHSRKGEDELMKWVTVREALVDTLEPVSLSEAKQNGGPRAFDWHVIRELSALNRERLAHAKPGKMWTSIPERLRPKCHQGDYVGFTNVYGRMEWDEPSPTITGGCTTLSKGRFGHPESDRVISVREAALLQTFPEEYVFQTEYMDHVCNIIGNALPCKFASAVAGECRKYL